MKSPAPRSAHAVFIHATVESLLSEGTDLKSVTLDEFKDRLKHTIRRLANGSKLAAA